MFWFGNEAAEPTSDVSTSSRKLTALQKVENIIFQPVNQILQSLKLQFRDWVENSAPQKALVSPLKGSLSCTNMCPSM